MLDKRLIVIGGKGGVGRTTVAAALGLVLARRGRRTLLAHVRCRQQLGRLLGAPKVGPEITEIDENLWAVNMDPDAALREIGMMVLRFRAVYRVVLENRLVRYFLRALPALAEYSMVGKAWYHTTEQRPDGQPKYDTVVFDGPATGHLVSMLRIPQVILDVVPSGPLTADAERVQALLSDPQQTGIWIVTLAEEMPISEAVDLEEAIRQQLGLSVEQLVVNMLYPDPWAAETPPPVDLAGRFGNDSQMNALFSAAQLLRQRYEVNQAHLHRLNELLEVPRIELPHLTSGGFGRRELDQLAALIERRI